MIQTVQPSQLESVNQLVTEAFGYQRPHHYFEDFPVWKQASKKIHRFGVFQDTRCVSHVGLREVMWGGIPSGLIGAVATASDFRGQGLSRALMEHAIAQAQKLGLQQLMLWGSEHEFYSKFGFLLQGHQARVSVLAYPKTHLKALVNEGYTPLIWKWLLNHPDAHGVPYQAEDETWFQQHQTVRWFWIPEPFAFVGLGRGLDLAHLVHEHGGDPTGVHALLAHVGTLDPRAEILLPPSRVPKEIDSSALIHESLGLYLGLGARSHQILNSQAWISGLQAC